MCNKWLLSIIVIFIFSVASAQKVHTIESVPNPKVSYGGFVSNPDSLISGDDSKALNYLLQEIEDSSSVQAAVVLLNSIGNGNPKDFANRLFNYWGIGEKGKNNGLLLLIVKDQRSWEFETGYGMEAILPDGKLKLIGEYIMVPKFKQDSMGVGVLMGMIAVDQVIQKDSSMITALGKFENPYSNYTYKEEPRDPTLFNGEILWSSITELRIFCWVGYVLFMLAVLISFFRKRSGGTFTTKGNSNVSLEKGEPISYLRWTFLYVILPTLVPVSSYFFVPSTYEELSDMETFLMMAAYIVVSICIVERMGRASSYCKNENKEIYVTNFDKENNSYVLFILALCFPATMVPFVVWTIYKKNRIRNAPFPCKNCSKMMHKLSAEEQKEFLSAGQQKEDELGSVDHDVWQCTSCNHTEKFKYTTWFNFHHKCKSCGFMTASNYKTETIVAATYDHGGTDRKHYKCKHCNSDFSNDIATAQLQRSNSSSGSSYSSSSGSSGSSYSGGGGGSSFGGGSSGGGGAGGKW